MRLIGSLHRCLQLSPHHVAPPLYTQTWTGTPTPRRSLPLLYSTTVVADPKSMSTATADARREHAAQAAERRLQAAMATTTAAPKAASSSCCESQEDDTCNKRRRVAREQQGFDDDEVTCVGVSGPAKSGQGRGGTGAVGSGADGAAPASKRQRPDGAAAGAATAATATSSALGAAGSRGEASITGSSGGPKAFRVVSWNIDCLNGENKMARVEEVCAIVLETEPTPDVILLQEVDGDLFSVLNTRLGAGGRYRAYPPRVPLENRYFTLMFVKVGTVTVLDSRREGFPHSRMGRDLATIRATFNGKPILIMTSHLESEKQSSGERKAQFNQALRQLLGFREGPAIFAGDTNLREAEVKQEKLAKEAGDMWQLCGADPEKRFTWDMANNDNLEFDGFQPRARYDRMFVNPLAKGSAKAFTLLGTERMAPPHSCFPSDHFGMDARFEW